MKPSRFLGIVGLFVGTAIGSGGIWFLVRDHTSLVAGIVWVAGGAVACSSLLFFPPINVKANTRRLVGRSLALGCAGFVIGIVVGLGGIGVLVSNHGLVVGLVLSVIGALTAFVSIMAIEGKFKSLSS